MEYQKILKEAYASLLEENVSKGINLDKYKASTFPIDDEHFEVYPGIIEPNLSYVSKMDVQDDYKSAIALYEAYPDLSNLEASSHAFWTTLSHTTLFNYIQKRWPHKSDKVSFQKHVLNHWFYASNLRKNALAHLWWSVAVSVDSDASDEHKYDLTKIFFENYSFRVVFWGSSNFFRSKEATRGILRFLKENKADIVDDGFEMKGKFISMYFNQLGAVKQLGCMPESFFSEELKRIKPLIMNAPKREKKMVTPEDDELEMLE